MKIRRLTLLGFYGLLTACGGPQATPPPASASIPAPEAEATPQADEILIVFLGDSLTAGFGLNESEAHPARIEARLREAGRPVRVVNAGVSGDTTAGGLARLDWLLGQKPDILVVSLGGNDGLRGVDLASSEDNLRQIVSRSLAQRVRVLLSGMQIPPNYGVDYVKRFAEIYPRLAADLGVPLLPFLLEGVAARPELNLADGIHPNVEGQHLVAETVLEYLKPLLEAPEKTP